MKISILPSLLNSIGLIFDIIGVSGIYFLKIRGINKVYQNPIIPVNVQLSIITKLNQVIEDLNKNIDGANEINKKHDKKSVSFFIMILFGFLLQLISIWISFSISYTN